MMVVGMPGIMGAQIFVKFYEILGPVGCKIELLIIPLRFQSTRMLYRECSMGHHNWSNKLALPILGANLAKFFPMRILTWNCRGAAVKEFQQSIADMVKNHSPMLIFILETRLPAFKVEELRIQLQYDSVHGVDAQGLSGGIWMLCDSTKIVVDILPHNNQAIHAFVQEADVRGAHDQSSPHLS